MADELTAVQVRAIRAAQERQIPRPHAQKILADGTVRLCWSLHGIEIELRLAIDGRITTEILTPDGVRGGMMDVNIALQGVTFCALVIEAFTPPADDVNCLHDRHLPQLPPVSELRS